MRKNARLTFQTCQSAVQVNTQTEISSGQFAKRARAQRQPRAGFINSQGV